MEGMEGMEGMVGGDSISWVMKTGDVAPRVEIKFTSLAFQASVLTITPPRFPDATTILLPTCLYGPVLERQTTTLIP